LDFIRVSIFTNDVSAPFDRHFTCWDWLWYPMLWPQRRSKKCE